MNIQNLKKTIPLLIEQCKRWSIEFEDKEMKEYCRGRIDALKFVLEMISKWYSIESISKSSTSGFTL